jgi:hypothetical protein
MTHTEDDKVNEIRNVLKKRIGGCFGTADLIFAGHKLDEDEAKKLRQLAFDGKIPLLEMEAIALEYLRIKGCTPDHQREQMREVRDFFSKKLTK